MKVQEGMRGEGGEKGRGRGCIPRHQCNFLHKRATIAGCMGAIQSSATAHSSWYCLSKRRRYEGEGGRERMREREEDRREERRKK